MSIWPIFFLYNALFTGMLGLSLPASVHAEVAKTVAAICFGLFLVLLGAELDRGGTDV